MQHLRYPQALVAVVLLLQVAGLPAAWSAERVYHESVPVVVDHVHDGDTLIVAVPSWPAVVSPIQVRVAGIDTPELHDKRPSVRALALMARDWVAAHLPAGSGATLRHVRRDKYFRLLADVDVVVDGEIRDLASELVRRGLARPYEGQGSKPW
jgi:endonuclease YncB( thermonuclease family)